MFKEEREIWENIEGFEGLYQVSNMGRVRSLDREDAQGRGWKGRMLSSKLRKNGYREVIICRDGKRKYMLVHRLVAEAFLSNQDNLPQVNHKDEDKGNNRVENLEWCDSKYNNNYGNHIKRVAEAREKPIYVVTNSGHRYYFSGVSKAARLLGLHYQNITACLHGRQKTCHGYTFEWAVAKACQV
jgi:hypothetical protein